MVRSALVVGIACFMLLVTTATGETTEERHEQATYVHTPLTYGAVMDGDGGFRVGDSSVRAPIESGETEVHIEITDATGLPVLAYGLLFGSVGWSAEIVPFCGTATLPLSPEHQVVFVDLPNVITTTIDAVEGTCSDPVTTATIGTVDLWFA